MREYILRLNCKYIVIVVWVLNTPVPTCASQQVAGVPLFAFPGKTLALHQKDSQVGLYGRAASSAAWHVSQWNKPGRQLPDFSNGQTSDVDMSIAITPLGHIIRQTGARLSCYTGLLPTEFDAFIGSNTRTQNPDKTSADMRHNNISLSRLNDLSVEAKVQLVEEHLLEMRPRPCADNKAIAVIAVVFTNTVNHTTLFYQIVIGRFRLRKSSSFWWAKGVSNRFGYNESVLAFGQRALYVGHPAVLKLSILPRILQLIHSPDVKIDSAPSHWTIAGVYFGSSVWGDVSITTRWQEVKLVSSID
jgi:hypothetical protein